MSQRHVHPASADSKPRPKYSGFSEIFISSSKLISIRTEKSFQPPTDIFETDNEIVIRSELAGMKPEEILISVDGNHLIISGHRDERPVDLFLPGRDGTKNADHPDVTAGARGPKRSFTQMEIDYGKFEKVIELFCPVDANESRACYKNGFLEIVIPKLSQSKRTSGSQEVTTIKHIEIIQGN
jgi:HSP20 family protein